MAFVICRDILELGWSKIAREFNLNHASIMHHYKKHQDLMAYDEYYKNKYNDILEVFKLQIDYVEPKELIREIVNIKKQRYNEYLKQKLRENEGKGQGETTFIG
jgi:chromosomal replication initiation ATPase DnaA